MHINLSHLFSKGRSLVIAFIILLPLTMGSLPAQSNDNPLPLFKDAAGGPGPRIAKELRASPTIARHRPALPNYALLLTNKGAPRTQPGNIIKLNLFEDAQFDLLVHTVAQDFYGGYVWTGKIVGEPLSNVVLVLHGQVFSANIYIGPRAFQVRFDAQKVHAIYEMDLTAFPDEAPPIEPDSSQLTSPDFLSSPTADSGSQVDIMVVYTAAIRAAAGGTTAMETLISLAVAEANTTFGNSGISFSLNLVNSHEVDYTETGNGITDLTRVTDPSDGYIDEVHFIRDEVSADEVAFLLENTGCGYGWIMATVSHSFQPNAFYVGNRSCVTGNLTFAHELGHNMGARHDWYVDSTVDGPYSYNHGYVYLPNAWRTVMAYASLCSAQVPVVLCTRLPYWSNPSVTYGGIPMGIAAGTSTGCASGNLSNPDCDADNSLTLNNTRTTVANFRDSTCAAPGVPTLLTPANGASTADTTPTFDWSDVAGAYNYQIQVDNNADFSSPEVNLLTPIVTSTHTPSSPLADAVYYWRVRSHKNTSGCYKFSAWSTTRTLTIGTPPSLINVAIYNHSTTADISYFVCCHANTWSEYQALLNTDPEGRFSVSIITDLTPATLAGFDRLILPDNAVPDTDLAAVDAWFTADKRIIAVDSAASFAAYSGYLFPSIAGNNGYTSHWDYSSTPNDQEIVRIDKPTEDYTIGNVVFSQEGDAQLFTGKLPWDALVLTTKQSDKARAYVVQRAVPGKGTIVFLGPYNPTNAAVHPLIRDSVEGGATLSPSVELLQNRSFEEAVPQGWQGKLLSTNVDTTDCGVSRTGSCSYTMTGDGDNSVLLSYFPGIRSAGDNVSLSVWNQTVGAGGTGSPLLRLVFIYTDETKDIFTAPFNTGTHGWQQATVNATAAKNYRMITVSLIYTMTAGDIWWDDISLTINGGANMFAAKNPSFEEDVPNTWVGKLISPSVDATDCTVAMYDTCSYRMHGDGDNSVIISYEPRAGAAGETLTLSVWNMTSNAGGTGSALLRLVIIYNDESKDIITAPFNQGSHGWELATITATTTKDYRMITVSLIYTLTLGDIWWDDVSLLLTP
ncbi:MAG: zinc-dependent metalloprotease [Anaerolineae bacterium]|nr:zinc-dependent metalloprotease [Anaerolineae bacterium]